METSPGTPTPDHTIPGSRDALTAHVAALLTSAGDGTGRVPATMLYNEGWMLRLVLDCLARRACGTHPLAPSDDRAVWRSEALLGTAFRARTRKDALSERHTHADGVVGHIENGDGKGDIRLARDARQFVVVEAKMFSRLSAGTTNARMFNQAARNVACMASLITHAGADAQLLDHARFVVIAPAAQVALGVFTEACDPAHLIATITARHARYEADDSEGRFVDHRRHRERTLAVAREWLGRPGAIAIATWEELLEELRGMDDAEGRMLMAFYAQCTRWNGREWGRGEA